jgi:capsular polysaccharide biosynthesis protein
MTAPRPTRDLDAEREVDLARWRKSLVNLWWIPVAGLVLGTIVGLLYSFRGGSTYKASALISLGQPTSPGGALVNSYGTNPRAVSQITSSAAVQAQAASRADMHASALRGHVSVAQVGSATGTGATRATPLISLTVTGSHPVNVSAAANVLANVVVQKTTASYVGVKIHTFQTTLRSVNGQLISINTRLRALTQALKAAGNLDPLQKLVIVSEEDNAEARQGNLIAQQEALQQQLAFAQEVESAKVVVPAKATKSTARSRNTSLVVGALIGLILGAIVAIVADGRIRH